LRRPAHAPLLAALLATACASEAGPPVVHWGVDECAHCHMILAEPRFAAVARGPAGEEARFDDLGCLVTWAAGAQAQGPEAPRWELWAHDAAGEGWLPVDRAHFTAGRVASPMGSGLRAWSSADAARSAEPAATVRTWPELLAATPSP
jgi:copper chaperone NosL